MKKLLLLCIFIFLFSNLTACSGKNKLPDDFVVILPDKQKIYIYMPRADAEAILGEGTIELNNYYCYDDIGLKVRYYKDELTYINLSNDTSCKLESGIESSYQKDDFIKANFLNIDTVPVKYYSIVDESYSLIDTKPEDPAYDELHKYLMITSWNPYSRLSDSEFLGYHFILGDLTSIMYGSGDE